MKKIIIGQVWRLKNKKIEIVIIHIDPKSMIGITAIFRNEDYVILNLPENSLMDDYQLTDEVDWTYVRPGTVVTINGLSGKYAFEGCVKRSGRVLLSLAGCPGWQPEELCSFYYEPEEQYESPQPETDWTKVELGTPMLVNGKENQYYYAGYVHKGTLGLSVAVTDNIEKDKYGWYAPEYCTIGELEPEPVKHKRTVWVNVYPEYSKFCDCGLALWSSKDEADAGALKNKRLACVSVDISFTVGEGL